MDQGEDGRRSGGEGGEMNKQPPRDRRQKEIMQVQPAQPQQPQKCPRCDSYNTKFCYYNNYSLSQPRYFCKTCRRYWTQGGTLRNVPVGGGCRKGKRAKNSSSSSASTSSSSENQNSSLPPPPPPQLQHTQARAIDPSSVIVANSPSLTPFYQGIGFGGFLSSLAAMNQLNPPPHPFDNQSLNIGGGSSNLGLLQGFNVAPFGSQRQIINRPSQFYQVGTAGSGGGRDNQALSLYSTSSEQGLIPSSMANANTNAAAATHHDWPQGFINSAASNRASDDASLWSTISTTSIGAANSDRNGAAAAAGSASDLVPNQWPHLPRFDPPS